MVVVAWCCEDAVLFSRIRLLQCKALWVVGMMLHKLSHRNGMKMYLGYDKIWKKKLNKLCGLLCPWKLKGTNSLYVTSSNWNEMQMVCSSFRASDLCSPRAQGLDILAWDLCCYLVYAARWMVTAESVHGYPLRQNAVNSRKASQGISWHSSDWPACFLLGKQMDNLINTEFSRLIRASHMHGTFMGRSQWLHKGYW